MNNGKEIKGYDGIFATRLRELMDSRGITQKILAEQTHTARQTISQYMDGTALPNAEKLCNICSYFEIPSDYLLGLTKSQDKDISNQAIQDKTGLNSVSINTTNAITNGAYPGKLFHEPTEMEIDLINYLLSDIKSIQTFFTRLFTYFYEKQEYDNNRGEETDGISNADIARHTLYIFMEQGIDNCYNNFFKQNKNPQQKKNKPGRKRKVTVNTDNTEN